MNFPSKSARLPLLLALLIAAACTDSVDDNPAFENSRQQFPLILEHSNSSDEDSVLHLPAHWSIDEITVHAYNNDLVLAYLGDGGPWAANPNGNSANAQFVSERAILKPGRGDEVGLPAQIFVAQLINWFKLGYDNNIQQIAGTSNGNAAHIDLRAAVTMGRQLSGTQKPDNLEGGPGPDRMVGQQGADVLTGNAGDDILIGGKDEDMLLGGEGDDTYIVNLDDGFDLIADEGGQDVVEFGAGITPEQISLLTEKNSINLQIRVGNQWNYLAITQRSNDDSLIEVYRFADGTQWTAAELETNITQVAMDLKSFQADLRERNTTYTQQDATDALLLQAARDAIFSAQPAEQCLQLPISPRADEYGSNNYASAPDDYFLVFHGDPANQSQRTQRQQLRVLAAAGIFRDELVNSPNGDASGEKFTLTWLGWSLMVRQHCVGYGRLSVDSVKSYRPTGNEGNHIVNVNTSVTDVQSWAKQSIVTKTFPRLAGQLQARQMQTMVRKQGDTWLPTLRGNALPNSTPSVLLQPPTHAEVADATSADGRIPVWGGPLCAPLPNLDRVDVTRPDSPWVTAARYPFRGTGGNAERNASVKEMLDVLVRFDVLTQHFESETDRRGNSHKLIAYALRPDFNFKRHSSSTCIEVAQTQFEVYSTTARGAFRGRLTAKPSYDWAATPEYFAALNSLRIAGAHLKGTQLEKAFGRGWAISGNLRRNREGGWEIGSYSTP